MSKDFIKVNGVVYRKVQDAPAIKEEISEKEYWQKHDNINNAIPSKVWDVFKLMQGIRKDVELADRIKKNSLEWDRIVEERGKEYNNQIDMLSRLYDILAEMKRLYWGGWYDEHFKFNKQGFRLKQKGRLNDALKIEEKQAKKDMEYFKKMYPLAKELKVLWSKVYTTKKPRYLEAI